MAAKPGESKAPCWYCKRVLTLVRRGLCYVCYKNPSIRQSSTFRGRGAVLPEAESCRNCHRRKAIKGKRDLCLECWRNPSIRERYPRPVLDRPRPRLTPEQQTMIVECMKDIEGLVRGLARRWGVNWTDREELLSAALEIVCRRGTRLKSGAGCNHKSFLLQAAVFGMRWAMKYGPLRRPNTVYLADADLEDHRSQED